MARLEQLTNFCTFLFVILSDYSLLRRNPLVYFFDYLCAYFFFRKVLLGGFIQLIERSFDRKRL